MGCEYFEERYSFHLDGALEDWERAEFLEHLESCRKCSARLKSMAETRARLRHLAAPRMPVGLSVQLRVLASHEHARRLARLNFSVRLRTWKATARLHFENLMRPVALPLAGGVLSTLLLFSALVPTLIFRHQVTNDPPLSYVDPHGYLVNWVQTGEAPRLEPVDSVVPSDENVVEVIVDDKGSVFDYSVRQGQLTPEMATVILWSQFSPAMFFGKPTWGKTLVVLPGRHSRSTRG
jgi:anti-sigma factor RsiW